MYRLELHDGDGWSSGNVHVVNSNGYFGPVCDDIWGSDHARVVCRQLGFADGTYTTNSHFGLVSSTYAMDSVRCGGTEEHLQDCTYSTTDDCSNGEGAGVYCSNESTGS